MTDRERVHMKRKMWSVTLFYFGAGMMLLAGAFGGLIVQSAAAQTQGTPGTDSSGYDLQRSYQIDGYNLVAKSGPERGKNIYFYKCWVCHNKYTIESNFGDKAPFLHLTTLFSRPKLISGDPVNEETVAQKIKNGGPGMPTFRTTMTDSDVADLVSYLRSGKCCYEGEDPSENFLYRAATHPFVNEVPTRKNLTTGPRGTVHTNHGDALEGMMVQLIAPNGVRTTVYTDEEGRYQFPHLQSGQYTLRIAKPQEFKPYQKDAVAIDGASKLEDIVLTKISDVPPPIYEALEEVPATREGYSQLSGMEMLWDLPGEDREKEAFHRACASGCHGYDYIFRNHYDERSWRLIIERMFEYSSGPLTVKQKGGSTRGSSEAKDILGKWLAKVRGPEPIKAPLYIFPRPRGLATRVIVTEYDVPRVMLSLHDVAGDAKGNIWYSSHKTPYVGRLDPRTGVVKEYSLPLTPGAVPGTHRVAVGKDGTVWFSENWAHKMTKFDPKTERFTQFPIETDRPLNTAGFSNFAVAPDGYIWHVLGGAVARLDPQTGKVVSRYPIPKEADTYDNDISDDGNFWAGGSPAPGGHYVKYLDIRTGKVMEFGTIRRSSPARGGFDKEGNAWFGGRGGTLVELDAKALRLREFWPPTPYTPYTDFYEAMPDKNGDVWAGELHGRGFLRLNPRTERWLEYVLPEPYAHNRRTWIDSSTDPISVWYADYHGYLVRIQPLD